MAVGIRTRTNELVADTVQEVGVRYLALRGDPIARLLTPAGLRDPYARYARLRDGGALLHNGRFDVWVATTHAQAGAIVRDPRFGVDNRVLSDYAPDADAPFADHEMLLRMDPPDHTRIRRLVGKAFAPRAVASWRPRVEKIAGDLLDEVDPRGFDLVGEFAAPLTIRVICDLLGVPSDDWRRFREWGDAITRTLGVLNSRAEIRLADEAGVEFGAYVREMIRRRREEPGDDLLSVMVAAEEEGDRLSDRELLANTALLLLAGFETTVNLIGNGSVALLGEPDQWALVRDHPDRLPDAVEELLRFDSPVQFTSRNANEDVEVLDHRIPAGRQVLVLLGSANHDPAVFAEPHRLDVTRPNARDHLAFSSGPHYCLGASLARLEGEVAFAALTQRFPALARAGRPVRRRTDLLRGYEAVPVAA